MAEFKRAELTSNDVISDTVKSLADFIAEARKTALKEKIRANTVILDKTFAKVNDIHFVVGRDVLHIPPMICGLEVRLTDELPDGYDFALVEAPETERERIVRTAKAEVAREIFERLHAHRKFDGHTVSIWLDDLVCIAKEYGIDLDFEKKYTEGE